MGKIVPPKIKGNPINTVINNSNNKPPEEISKELQNFKGSKKKLEELNESIVASATIHSLVEDEKMKDYLKKALNKAIKKFHGKKQLL